MKVLAAVIIPPSLRVSGAVNAAKALSAAIGKHCRVDVAVMAAEEGRDTLGEAQLLLRPTSNLLGFTQGVLPDKFRTLFYRSDLHRLVAEGDYDLVHIHNPIPALEMKRVAAACVQRGVPYVVSTHGFVEVTSGGDAYGLSRFYEKLAWCHLIEKPLAYVVDHAAMIFALSDLERDLLHGLGVGDERIAVVTNGVNPDYYEPIDEPTINRVATDLGLDALSDQKRPTLAFLGNHTANKGVTDLLEAFVRLDRPCQLVVCGKKKDAIDYDHYLQRCGPDQNLVFTDFIPDESVRALFCYADVFAYPTRSDTLPLVILEAMASQLAVVSTQIGGIPFQITDDCGVLVPPSDPDALVSALSELLADPDRIQAMGAAAEERVRTIFDWDVAARAAVENYRALLSR